MEYNTMHFFRMLKGTHKFSFKSKSLKNSKMDWNYTGTGKTKVITEISSNGCNIYYDDEIFIKNRNFIIKDKKMWYINGNELEFYHFRNNEYERILKFVFVNDKFVLKNSYECDPDIYSGDIQFFDYGFSFSIRIEGKRKDELIEYTYYLDNY